MATGILPKIITLPPQKEFPAQHHGCFKLECMIEPNFDPHATQRIDSWLWAVRIFKTRTLAATVIKGGHVRVNAEKVKASYKVKVGDEVHIRQQGIDRILIVQGCLASRGPAPVAQACYLDHSPEPSPLLRAPVPRRDKGLGRPTKKDRRMLDKLRGRSSY